MFEKACFRNVLLFFVRLVVFFWLQIVTEPFTLYHCSFVIICAKLSYFYDYVEDPTRTEHIFVILSYINCVGVAARLNRFRHLSET